MSTHNSELQITRFPKGSPTEPKNPAQLYGELYPVTSPDTIHMYASCALTSGGAIRFKEESEPGTTSTDPWDRKLEVPDLISLNGDFAASVIDLLLISGELNPDTDQVTLPHLIGSQFILEQGITRHWKEIEYLCFWCMVLCGMTSDAATDFYESLLIYQGINWSIFNDYTASRDERVAQYKNLETFAVEFVNNLPAELKNLISVLIMIPDSHLSLGATFEQRFAALVGIPIFEVGIDMFGDNNPIKSHPLWVNPVFRWLIFEEGIFRSPDHSAKGSNEIAKLYPVDRPLEYGVPNPEGMTVLFEAI